MNGFAPLIAALALAQAAPPPGTPGDGGSAAPAAPEQPAARTTSPPAGDGSTTRSAEREPGREAEPGREIERETETGPGEPAGPPRPGPPPRGAGATGTRAPRTSPAPQASPAPPSTPASPSRTSPSKTSPSRTATAKAATSEPGDAERTARAFLDALVRGDADALARESAERFSFDGETRTGREAIRSAWRGLLAGRRGSSPAPSVGALEILPVGEAVARYGTPPSRIAPLARPGGLVAVADVGGRPVVLFLGREGGRMAVLGMHD